MAQFAAGVLFFGLFPIASRIPQYRLLASPMKWLFWKVPTDGKLRSGDTCDLLHTDLLYIAEWAIARLQAEASHRKEALRQADGSSGPNQEEKAVNNPNDPGEGQNQEVNLGNFHCTSQSHHGDLCVTSRGVKYKTAVRSHILWELRFDDLSMLQKVGAGEGLVFVLADGERYRVSGLKSRNEVFTQIIGYSDLRWQTTG